MWISSSTEITQSLQSSPNLKSLEFYSAMLTQFEVTLKESIIFLDSVFKESDIEGKAPIDKEKEAVESEKATTEKDQVSFLKQKLQEFNLEPLKKIEWNEISEIAIAGIIANIKDLKTTMNQFIDNFKKKLPHLALPIYNLQKLMDYLLNYLIKQQEAMGESISDHDSSMFNWHLPSLSSDLVIRSDLTQQLEQELNNTHRIILKSNYSGLGKTQLALGYAYHFSDKYKFKIWFYTDNLAMEYLQFALNFGLIKNEEDKYQVRQRVLEYLEANPGWLIVYDNVDNIDDVYLPKKGGDILIIKSFVPMKLRNSFSVGPMSLDQSTQLSQKLLEKTDPKLWALNNFFGCVPLAVVQASAYIRHNQMAADDYLGKMESRNSNSAIFDRCTVNLQFILEDLSKTAHQAYLLLRYLAVLHPGKIPYRLIKKCLPTEIDINALLEKLANYFLITIERRSGFISIHRLTQDCICKGLNTTDYQNILLGIMNILHGEFSREMGSQETEICQRTLLPHLLSVTQRYEAFFLSKIKKDELIYANLLWDIGKIYYYQLVKPDVAVNYLTEALPIFEANYGKPHAQLVDLLVDSGKVYGELKLEDEKQETLNRASEIIVSHFGKEHSKWKEIQELLTIAKPTQISALIAMEIARRSSTSSSSGNNSNNSNESNGVHDAQEKILKNDHSKSDENHAGCCIII